MFAGLAGRDLEAMGIPSEEEYVAAYCRRTGRDSIPDMDYYVAFNLFRLAGILHGILGRVKLGTAASKHAEIQGAMTEPMALAAWAEVEKIIGKS